MGLRKTLVAQTVHVIEEVQDGLPDPSMEIRRSDLHRRDSSVRDGQVANRPTGARQIRVGIPVRRRGGTVWVTPPTAVGSERYMSRNAAGGFATNYFARISSSPQGPISTLSGSEDSPLSPLKVTGCCGAVLTVREKMSKRL